MWVARKLERLGGVAETSELLAMGVGKTDIEISVGYRKILRVRRGVYALPELPDLALRALRAGGRLACVSALEYHRQTELAEQTEQTELAEQTALAEQTEPAAQTGPAEPIHILVRANASRLPATDNVVVHWSRRTLAGTRVAVSPSVARDQAESCAVVRTADQALVATSSTSTSIAGSRNGST